MLEGEPRSRGSILLSTVVREVLSMQRFVAELSTPIDKTEFERSWRSDPSLTGTQPKVEFVFAGQRVSVVIHSDSSDQWPSSSFHRTFSAAIRRLDHICNVRWL